MKTITFRTIKKTGLTITGLFMFFFTFAQSGTSPNIILMIGDGMGLSQISALYVDTGYTNFNRLPVTGLVRVSPHGAKITDSAAGATAFSTGVKTYNGAIGVDQDTVSVPTIMERLKKSGYASGVVVTSSITHATPASFYAHVAHRDQEEEIALQLPGAGFDFIAGGGLDFMEKRKDRLNLMDSLSAKGYTIFRQAIDEDSAQDTGPRAHILAAKELERYDKGRGDFLPRYTEKALRYLSSKNQPFFLLIEGSQIDWAGHANKADYLLEELRDFDNVIGKVLDFAQATPNTLVIVTADHETGGFSILPGNKDYSKIKYQFASKEHSAALIPLFARGIGAELFSGIMENTDIHKKITEIVGIGSDQTTKK